MFSSLCLAPQAIPTALAYGVTMKVEHPFAADSAFNMQFVIPWTQKLAQEAGGRLHFHIESGVSPARLFDRASAGDADLVWAPIDSAPGRFSALEAFELPLMMNSGAGASRALWEYVRLSDAAHRELDGLRPLALHPCPQVELHLRSRPVASAADIAGLTVATQSQIARDVVADAGGTAVMVMPFAGA